jgi:hypothetical protein
MVTLCLEQFHLQFVPVYQRTQNTFSAHLRDAGRAPALRQYVLGGSELAFPLGDSFMIQAYRGIHP